MRSSGRTARRHESFCICGMQKLARRRQERAVPSEADAFRILIRIVAALAVIVVIVLIVRVLT